MPRSKTGLAFAPPITIADFRAICRLCLTNLADRSSVQLFQDPKLSNIHRSSSAPSSTWTDRLPELIKQYIGVPVRNGDGLPSSVCRKCSTRLYAWQNFRTSCGRAMRTLLEVQRGKPTAAAIHKRFEFVESQADEKQEQPADVDMKVEYMDDKMVDIFNVSLHPDDVQPSSPSESIKQDNDIVDDTPLPDDDQPISPFEAIKEEHLETDADDDDLDQTDHTENVDQSQDVEAVAAAAAAAEEAWRSIDVDRPEQCYICGIVATRLRNHMRSHPETMSFKCQHCSGAFSTNRGLDRHMLAVHPHLKTSSGHSQPSIQERRQRSRKLRLSGKAFTHPDHGNLQPGRRVRSPCACRLRCAERATPEIRQRSFDEYYALGDRHLQYQYLAVRCDRTRPPVYQNPRKPTTGNVFEATKGRYFLFDAGFSRVYVCRETFMATFDVNVRTVRTAQIMTNALGECVPVGRPPPAAIRQSRPHAKFQQPCDCRMQCADLVTPAIRQRTCDEFYSLNERDQQYRYLMERCDRSGAMLKKAKPNRNRKGKPAGSAEANARGRYFLYDVNGEARVYVCRRMFLSVFGVSLRMLQTATAMEAMEGTEARAETTAVTAEAETAEANMADEMAAQMEADIAAHMEAEMAVETVMDQ